ncbi:Ribosomal RNA small subunit methyltransferase [Nymphaea thermarum]|nr:Ribosomal RNA small subunit methyltransferase [Nymphaea thermarum]
MVRPYAVRGLKRKKRDVEKEAAAGGEEEKESMVTESVGIHTLHPAAAVSGDGAKAGVVFVLEKASLEFASVGKTYQLLNSDDHVNFFRKHNLDPAAYRPDITHQALLAILDSPLNKSGRIRGLYVHTEKNVLIQVNPQVRLPRTYKRFSGVMLQVLQNKNIRAADGSGFLLRKVENPVTRHLPANSHRIGLSYSSQKLVQMSNYVASTSDDLNLVFVVGAMANGKIDTDYIDDLVAVSAYPLTAAYCIARICYALEQKWKIL